MRRKPKQLEPAVLARKLWQVCNQSGRAVETFEHNELDEAQIAADEIGGFVRPMTPALAARCGERFTCPERPSQADAFDYEMRDAA